jgi:hypothetical protein
VSGMLTASEEGTLNPVWFAISSARITCRRRYVGR